MNATYKKGAALANAGKVKELEALINSAKKTEPFVAVAMGPLLESAYLNLGKR